MTLRRNMAEVSFISLISLCSFRGKVKLYVNLIWISNPLLIKRIWKTITPSDVSIRTASKSPEVWNMFTFFLWWLMIRTLEEMGPKRLIIESKVREMVFLRGNSTNCPIDFQPRLCALYRPKWVMNILKKVHVYSLFFIEIFHFLGKSCDFP